MIFIFYIFVFVFGLCIGSFLNCYIYRLEQKKKITGRSFCPHCKRTLNWQDLFPIFSYLFLCGKCRYCKAKISAQYPIVELATGAIFLLIFNLKFVILSQFEIFQLSNITNLIFLFYLASALIIIFIYDLKHYLIPDKVLFPAIIITFVYRLFYNFLLVPNFLLAVIIASGFFLLIFLVSRGRWMGFGDVKLAILMGLLLGFPNVLVALFFAFFFGAIIGVILMVLPSKRGGQKIGLKSEIPFGPFLIMGTFVALFWANQIIQWYLHILII